MQFIIFLIIALLIVACIAIPRWRDAHHAKKLKNYVAWCLAENTTGMPSVKAPFLPLMCYVLNAQRQLNIRPDFKVYEDKDSLFFYKIIDEYKRDLQQSYLRDSLTLPKSRSKISNTDFFLYTLCVFLMKHQHDRKFSNFDMLGNELDRIGFSDGSFNIIFSLSDFSILYHKILYITYLYCENSATLNPNQQSTGKSWFEESLIDILETKQVELEY